MDWKAFWNDSPQVRDPDLCRQVGRTINGVSYSDREIETLVDRTLSHLGASPDRTLLDLACGNGLITSRLASHFEKITAVDFSRPLVETAREHFGRTNVDYVIGDAVELDVVHERYDCVLVSGALQHFAPDQVRRMFQRLKDVIKPGGRIVLGDVADRDRIWNFYRGVSGRLRYACDLMRRKPIIGYWWRPSALLRIASALGWTLSIRYQTADQPNHYFRYDAVLETPSDPLR